MRQLELPAQGSELPINAVRMALARADTSTRLMLTLAAGHGLRRESIARVHTVDLTSGPDPGDWLRVHVEGSHPHSWLTPIEPELAQTILDADGYLFPGAEQGHLSARWLGRCIAGALPDGASALTLRRTFVLTAANHQRTDYQPAPEMPRAEREFWQWRHSIGPRTTLAGVARSPRRRNPIPGADGLHPRITLHAGRPIITARVPATLNADNSTPDPFAAIRAAARGRPTDVPDHADSPDYAVWNRYVEVEDEQILVGTFEMPTTMLDDFDRLVPIDHDRRRTRLVAAYLGGLNDRFLEDDLRLRMPDGTPFLLPRWQSQLRAEHATLARLREQAPTPGAQLPATQREA